MSGFMMQRGMMIVCGDAADGIGDSMYEGTVYVGGEIASLGRRLRRGRASRATTASCSRSELGRTGSTPVGQGWKKLVAGRKLWNFSKHEYDAWRGAL